MAHRKKRQASFNTCEKKQKVKKKSLQYFKGKDCFCDKNSGLEFSGKKMLNSGFTECIGIKLTSVFTEWLVEKSNELHFMRTAEYTGKKRNPKKRHFKTAKEIHCRPFLMFQTISTME